MGETNHLKLPLTMTYNVMGFIGDAYGLELRVIHL